MTRLAVLLALLLAPAAVAQEAPDERAAAQAMADAGTRFDTAVEAKEDDADALERGARCRAAVRRVPKQRRDEVVYFRTRNTFRAIAALIRDDLGRLRTDLADVQTRDPALLSGRAAYRQGARLFMALPEPGSLCAELRAWVRAGTPRSASRKALDEVVPVLQAFGREYDRKLEAAADRMIELGVPAEQAEGFADG